MINAVRAFFAGAIDAAEAWSWAQYHPDAQAACVAPLHFDKRETRGAAEAFFRELCCGPDGRLLVSRSVALKTLVNICVHCETPTSQVPRRRHVEMAFSILDDLDGGCGLDSASHWGLHGGCPRGVSISEGAP